jgi:tRNA_anti-like
MALRSCKECKREVSTEAKTCPNCGVKNPTAKGLSKLVLYGGGTLLVLGFCSAIGGRKPKSADPGVSTGAMALASDGAQPHLSLPGSTPQPQQAPAAALILTDKEQDMLRILLLDDVSGFADGAETMFGESVEAQRYVVVSSDELQKAYDKNEVAGDKSYRGKRILLRGQVASIDRSIGENYFVSFRGGTNTFAQPKARMADGYTDYLAALEKGQTARFVCNGDGMLMRSAMLTGCVPFQDWATELVSKLASEFPTRAGAGDQGAIQLLAIAIGAAAVLPENSACWSEKPQGACEKELTRTVGGRLKRNTELQGRIASRLRIEPSTLDKLFK